MSFCIAQSPPSIILLNIPISPLKQLFLPMQLILHQCFAQGLLHLAYAGDGVLPAGVAHDFDDGVDVVDDALDDDGGFVGFGGFKEFREGGLGGFALFGRVHVALGFQGFLGELAELLDEVKAAI